MKALAVLLTAALATLGVACAGGGPSDEFCNAFAEFDALAASAEEPTSEQYGELDPNITEGIALLEEMQETAGDDEIEEDLVVIREAFEEVAETGDTSAVAEDDVQQAGDDVEAYGRQCEGSEEPPDEETEEDDAAVDTEALETALVDAATAEEVVLTDSFEYTESVEELEAAGLSVPEGVTLTIEANAGKSYCIEAESSGEVMHLDSTVGSPETGGC